MANKGKDYEKRIFRLCNKRGCIFPGTSNAGGGSGADICLTHNNKPLNIECKSAGADWGQESLQYMQNQWSWTKVDETTKYLESINVTDEINKNFIPKNIPPSNLSSAKWKKVRQNFIGVTEKDHDQQGFDKAHIPLTLEPLIKFYNSKNCYYLQLSEHGLYHLGEDRYGLGTPEFDGTIYFRFRAKMHNNFSRRMQGPNTSKDGNKKSNGRNVSKIIMLSKFLFSGIDNVVINRENNDTCIFNQTSNHFDPTIFEVTKNNVPISVNTYEEIFELVDETTGKEECEKGTQVKILKYMDKDDPSIFTIKPSPWNYSFFGIMKLDQSPEISPLSLAPLKSQALPKINF
jgi:hypothetical protein